jgi:hypothetical protein
MPTNQEILNLILTNENYYMEESRMASNVYNSKIKNLFLIILLSILFTITAIIIQHPTQVYAGDNDASIEIQSTINSASFDANEEDQAGEDQAGYLYWAASGKRSGFELYVVTDEGQVVWRHAYFDLDGKTSYGDYANSSNYANAVTKLVTHATANYNVLDYDYLADASTVYYSGGWKSKGTTVADWLVSDYTVNGAPMQVTARGQTFNAQKWMYLIAKDKGWAYLGSILIPLVESANQNSSWNVFYEPISVNYLYTNNTFGSNGGHDTNGLDYDADSPIPAHWGTIMADGTGHWAPYVFIADATSYLSLINSYIGGPGDYTWKFYNKQLPFSLCLEEDVVISKTGAKLSKRTLDINSITGTSSALTANGNSGWTRSGVGIASIDIKAFKSPIHTYWEENGSPGKPEPHDNKPGSSAIYKTYYEVTTTYDKSTGEVKSIDVVNKGTYYELNTTDYISIDDEASVNGYALKLWTASRGENKATYTPQTTPNTTPVTFKFTKGLATQSGTDPGVITLATGYNTVNLILVKEIEKYVGTDDPNNDYFELTQSTLVKRVNFSQNTATDFQTHYFIWQRLAFNSKATTCDGHTHKHQIKENEYKEDTTGYSKKMYKATVTCGGHDQTGTKQQHKGCLFFLPFFRECIAKKPVCVIIFKEQSEHIGYDKNVQIAFKT